MELSELVYFTDDVEATSTFYRALFDRDPVFEQDHMSIFDVDGVEVLVHQRTGQEKNDVPNEDHVQFAVENVDGTFDALADAGLEVIAEPAEYDWGRSAFLRDPDGRQVELTEA